MFVERVGVDSVLEVNQEPKSVRKFLNGSSAGKHDQAEVDISSSVLSSIQNCQKKKKKQARKKRESSSCPIGSLGSNEEGALSSAPVVKYNTERKIPSKHLGKAEDGSSVLGGGEISQVASVGPNSEILSGEKKKSKRKKKRELTAGSSVLGVGEISQEVASVGPNSEILSGEKKSKRKKKRELNACPLTSLGSTEEDASPSVLVVPDSPVGEISLKQLDEVPAPCNSVKLMEEVVVGNGNSREIGFGKCPNGESEFGKMKEKSIMDNLADDKTSNGRIHRRKKRKSSACCISSLESIEEGIQESSAAYTCLNHLNEAPEPSYSGKIKEEMVGGLIISQEKASGECPDGRSACGNQRKKSKMGNLEKHNAGNTVVMDLSLVDIPDTDFEQDSSVREILSNHLGKAEDGSSILAVGEISQEKASSGPNSELLSRKKKKESKRKKNRKLSDCPMYSLGSTEEGASPSVLAVFDSSVGQISLKQLDKLPASCNLVKLKEEVVPGNGTSLLDGGKISQEIDSGECPYGKSDFGKKEDSKMGNLEENNAGHGRIHRRKKRESFACSIGSLESTEESLQESSVGYTCLNHMDKAPEPSYTGKMMEEVVVGLGISQEKASYECPVGEPSSRKRRKKSEMEEKLPVMDVFMVDIPETDFEQFNKDKLDVVQNTLLSKEDRASYDALGSVPSVDNLNIQQMLKGAIPSSSKLGAMIESVSLESPQQPQGGTPLGSLRKKLLVLDVNGLLADIVPCGTGEYKPHKVLSQKAVFKRPFCDDFLQFCFDRFHVGVWSSRNRKNVNSVLDFLMGKSKSNMLFCWDQSDCTKTGYKTVENREKPLLLKELKKLWEKRRRDLPWASGDYNESNTLLLDDSPYKALRNPPNTAIFPHSYCYKDTRDNSLGPGGDLRVYLEGLASADHVQKYVEQNPFGQRPITNKNLSWRFYRKIIGNSPLEKGENATNDPSDYQQQEEDASNDSLASQQEEDTTEYSSACQQQEKDATNGQQEENATNYSLACQQGS